MRTVITEWLKQVEKHPEKICLKFSDRSYSFQQIENRSNCIAQELIKRKIGENTKVALKIRRSEKVVFFILGILKTGASYIP